MYRQHYPNDPGMHNMPTNYSSRASAYRVYPELSTWDKIRRSFLAIIVGVILLTIGSGLIFWNEGRAVQTSRSLDEGLRSVRVMQSSDVIFEENNGKLVHISGPLKTSKALYDEEYSVAVSAVKLRRRSEMYQWVEHENKREIHDGESAREEITYSYNEEWIAGVVPSSSFNNRLHQNPETIPVESKMFVAENAQVGNYHLAPSLIEHITNFQSLHPTDAPKHTGVKLHQGIYYHNDDPLQPKIGDLRVIFEYAGLSGTDSSRLGPPDTVSILAKQSSNQLTAYLTDAGDEIEVLYIGEYTAEQMIGQEHMTNTLKLWLLRFVGWLLMFVGFGCQTSFLVTMTDSVPILREVMALGSVSFSTTLSISLSLLIIAIGWIWYRPYLGLSILAMATLPFFISRFRYQATRTYRPV